MKNSVTKLWEMYESTLRFQKQQNYSTQWPINVDFYEGRQWPKATNKTKTLPRPVYNIIQFICQNKKSNVLSSATKAVYRPTTYLKNISVYEEEEDKKAIEAAELFTHFAEYIDKKIKIADLDDKAMEDATVLGTYIYHFFWDVDFSENGVRGNLNGEIIDPINIGFADPQEKDEQKQDWIIISSRMDIDKAKKLAKKNGIPEAELSLIEGDNEENPYDTTEQTNLKRCTVITRYFRRGKEVFFEKATKRLVIQPPISLTPATSEYKITRYPIVVGDWKSKRKSIFGIGEVEPLITTQKAINFTNALILLSVQNIGFPKTIVDKKVLEMNTITNEPGEIIVDPTKTGMGIKYLMPPSFTGQPLNIIDSMLSITRSLTGSTEVVTGETIGRTNMSGTAIAALQTQAKVPIEIIQKKFWRVKEDIAKIYEQFFKAYYTDERTFTYKDKNNIVTEKFRGSDYADINFETKVDVGSTTLYSEAMALSVLEQLKANGDIDLMTYVELYPDNAMPFKERLKQLLEEKKLPDGIEKTIMNNPELYNAVINLVTQSIQTQNNGQINLGE